MTEQIRNTMSKVISFFTLLLLATLLGAPQLITAQSKAQITEVDFFVRNDTLFVSYDLIKTKKNEWFEVTLTVKTLTGKVINPVALSGHAGKFIAGGKGKQIVWAITKDNVFIDDEIYVELRAPLMGTQQTEPAVTREEPKVTKEPEYASKQPGEHLSRTYSKGGALALSAIVPGLGITKQKEGGAYWLMGVATYGAVAGGVVLNLLANSDYNKYKDATSPSSSASAADLDAFYNSATSKAQIGKILYYSAAGIWVANMVWTALTPNKVKSAFSFHAVYDPSVNKPMISMTVKF
ncbi:MAG: hypothetical protein HQ542_11985 [Bacteroidia bacterium]|nr:hypothetical protein [Bacteroidia bacterium]